MKSLYIRRFKKSIPKIPLVTAVYIQLERYFLFAYTVLTSITNKLGGVIMILNHITD